MEFVRQHTRFVPPSERGELWGQINKAHFGEMSVEAMDNGLDEAQLLYYRLADLRIYQIDVPAHKIRREERHADDGLDDCYKLLMQLQGHGRIEQRSRCFELRPNDWSLYDPRVPYTIENFKCTSLLAVLIPRDRLRGFTGSELHTCESPTHGGIGLAAVLGSFLRSLSEQLQSLPDDSAQAVSETILGLLATTLARRQSDAAEHATLPEVLRSRVRLYIQSRWADPALDISEIAAALRCSKRHLHRAFDESGETIDRYIWKTRLSQARQLLQSEQACGQPIGQVAGACGFRTPAHFSRMFKEEFGVPPTEARRLRTTAGD